MGWNLRHCKYYLATEKDSQVTGNEELEERLVEIWQEHPWICDFVVLVNISAQTTLTSCFLMTSFFVTCLLVKLGMYNNKYLKSLKRKFRHQADEFCTAIYSRYRQR